MTNNEKNLSDTVEVKTSRGLSIAGRKQDDGVDFYETPKRCIDKLLELEKFEGCILEPCSGNGAISRILENKYKEVISFDIREDELVYGKKGINFLDRKLSYNNIITNPPYRIAQDFIERSLKLTDRKVAMFLKLQFLESVSRYKFFKNTPLKKVYVFCKRPTLYPANGPIPKNKGTIAYAWYIREHGYEGEPTIDRII